MSRADCITRYYVLPMIRRRFLEQPLPPTALGRGLPVAEWRINHAASPVRTSATADAQEVGRALQALSS